MKLGLLAGIACALLATGAAAADHGPVTIADPSQCPAGQSPTLILGFYHMNNPGMDAISMEADDVLSDRRQAEIATLVDSLTGFAPTKVMVEAPFFRSPMRQRYTDYLAGKFELRRNEIYQVGFRLAERMELERVESIDFQMWMNGNAYSEINFNPTRADAPDDQAEKSDVPRELSEEELLLRNSTVSEYLAIRNDPERVQAEHIEYYMSLLDPDPASNALYGRSDLLANWYNRNFRMWTNVMRQSERPEDRIFLMVGAGHLAILRQLAADTPDICLVSPMAYLRGN